MTAQVTNSNPNDSGNKRQPEMSAGKNKAKGALSYLLLPGIVPEIKQLTQGQFGYLAYLIAIIYQTVRILPKNHPYTKPENIGKFNIRQAIAAAADNISISKKNIDQIIVFVAILAAMLLLIVQFISFLFFIFMSNAWATPGIPANAGSIFITPLANQETDIAFFMIREVFGLPTMFGPLTTLDAGGNAVTGEGARTGLHIALQTLFHFYNLAMLFVGVLIFLYYLIVVVGETAQTGIPFGQRFSHVYAPLRLVIAIGLLVPLNYGFNGAQYMAFYAAQLGSSFATNGWLRFNEALGTDGNPLGVQNAALIAQPNIPDVSGIVQLMSVIVACKHAYNRMNIEITPYYVTPIALDDPDAPDNEILILDPLGGRPQYDDISGRARASNQKGHLSINFGEVDADKHGKKGHKALCGVVKVPFQMTDQTIINGIGVASPAQIEAHYYDLIGWLWANNTLDAFGQDVAQAHSLEEGGACAACSIDYKPDDAVRNAIVDEANGDIRTAIHAVFIALRSQVQFNVQAEILKTGWGGAGIWYNKIAQANGAYVTATMNIPNVYRQPAVMEAVLAEKQKGDGAIDSCKAYDPNLANNKETRLTADQDYVARVLNEVHKYWRCDKGGKQASNFFWDAISAVFGLNGLFNIREEVPAIGLDGETIMTTIHPLAKLSAIGKSLIESAVQNLGLAMGMSFGGGMLGVLGPHIGPALQSASQMFVSIATVGLSIGFILYYILPFLPFMYFFFAVGGWVKGLFEAMVGTPLWALAHLRIDGDGLPGRSAMSGYLLIFEIFLRPILTVFGLIGGLAIFTAMATILNEIFNLAVTNATGATIVNPNSMANETPEFSRHLIDTFFFTIVYAIILYMMAMASFKMITLVPNNILRWLGQSVSSFNDQAGDPAQGLTQYAAMGGARIGGQLAGATAKLSEGGGAGIGQVFGLAGGKSGGRGGQ